MRAEQNPKNRIVLLIAAVFISLTALVQSVAFLTRSITADNVLSFGSVKIQIIETTLDASGKEIEVSDGETLNITKDSDISRIVRLKNVGNHPLFARISLDLIGEKADGSTFTIENMVSCRLNEIDWLHQDGWYYYKKVLEPNITTEELMTKIIFDIDAITRDYPGESFTLHINAQAVQSENNNADILKAFGWPEEQEAKK